MISNTKKQAIKLTKRLLITSMTSISVVSMAMTNLACAGQNTLESERKEALSQAIEIKSDELFQIHKVAFRDLNNDGKKDAIIAFQAKEYCGSGGCSMVIYEQYFNSSGKMSYRKISGLTIIRFPIYVYKSNTNGWNDISVNISGGGQPSSIVKLQFNGTTYPSNPTDYNNKYIETIDNELAGELLLSY